MPFFSWLIDFDILPIPLFKAVFFLLTSNNEVIQRREQKIRITANPGRDAKHVENLQSRKAMSALIKKEAQLSSSRPLVVTLKKNGKKNDNEPVEKQAKYSINMEGKLDIIKE